MGKVMAVCISEERGTQKERVKEACLLEDYGIQGDAHAGNWHRQVSLLSYETIQAFKERGARVEDGAFGENVVVQGIDLTSLPVGARLACGDILLEVTQIGKECHNHCRIYQKMGECIMPANGVFARVICGGVMREGDEMRVCERDTRYRVGIVTLSDKGAAGEREDLSGQAICDRLDGRRYLVAERVLLPDDRERIRDELIRLCDRVGCDLILTTGGTGFSARDNTPEATLDAAERSAPGIAEAIRAYSVSVTKRAMLSRGVSVIRGRTLIINLPGSPKAVKECMEYLEDVLPHGLDILSGEASECAGS